jgi:hypothetical protein
MPVIADRMFFMYVAELRNIREHRYLFQDEYRVRPYDEITLILNQDNQGIPWMNDTEFLGQFRMNQTDFDVLVGLIENNPIFQKKIQFSNRITTTFKPHLPINFWSY